MWFKIKKFGKLNSDYFTGSCKRERQL